MAHECQGNCCEHDVEVRLVHVTFGYHDWGFWWYCENAIAEDIYRGLSMEYVEEQDLNYAPATP